MSYPDFDSLAHRFNGSGVRAIALTGSYARGDAGPLSDVDLLRVIGEGVSDLTGAGSYLIDDRLVTVGDADAQEAEAWFSKPEQAVNVIASLREARALLDPSGTFAKIQERAHAFVWDEPMQTKANAYASVAMVGWIEEVHKGLEALHRLRAGKTSPADQIEGRLLNAHFGCTRGLSHVIHVQRGVLINSDNAFYNEVANVVGTESEWSRLRGIAFGVTAGGEQPPTLVQQVEAGLRLYAETANLLGETLNAKDAPLIWRTVERIQENMPT